MLTQFEKYRTSWLSVWTITGVLLIAISALLSEGWYRNGDLDFDATGLTVSDLPVGDKSEIALVVSNPNRFPIRIVGMSGSCGPKGCVEAAEFKPGEVKAGEKKKMMLQIKSPRQVGPIEATLTVYYVSSGLRQREFVLTGNATVPEDGLKSELTTQ
ncbi:MAG: hypothetical protein WCI02_11945 [Planctomycetota bacterium]